MWFLLASLSQAQTFDEPSRWLVRSEVDLPAVMWMAASLNTEARMQQWDLDLVLDCAAGDGSRRKDVVCTIGDVGLTAAAHPNDSGLLMGILDEVDGELRSATLTLVVGANGSLRGVKLDGIQTLRRRDTAMQENVRLMVSRAVAGFDLPMYDDEVERWDQRGGWIAQMPAGAGTLAGGRIFHQRSAEGEGTQVGSAGRVTLEPHSKHDWPPLGTRTVEKVESALPQIAWDQWEGNIGVLGWFDTEIAATARLDGKGGLLERTWTADGAPTPSSRMANGSAGYRYRQAGSIVRLGADERPELRVTGEVAVEGPSPTAIQTYETLGVAW